MSVRIMHPTHVVAGIDFELGWENVLAHAASHAAMHHAALHLVHALQPTHWLLRQVLDGDAFAAHERDLRELAHKRLGEAAATVTSVPTSFEVRVGKPSQEILAAGAELKAGLVVCGVGSPKAMTTLVRGGTADRLLRLSPVPLLVVGPEAPRPIVRIVSPTALGPGGACAITNAHHLVARRHGEVDALYTVSLPSMLRSYSGDVVALSKRIEDEARMMFAKHLEAIELPPGANTTVPVFHAVDESTPIDEIILNEARSRNADMIVCALGGRRFASAVIGKVTDKLIRALPCSLLGLPDTWVTGGRATTPAAGAD
jgi:nucleotide-binding universal stress UspA family protein